MSRSEQEKSNAAAADGAGSLHFDIRLSSSRSQQGGKPKQKSSMDRVFDKHFAQVRDALELLEAYVVPDHIAKFDSVQRIIDESIFQAKKDANRLLDAGVAGAPAQRVVTDSQSV